MEVIYSPTLPPGCCFICRGSVRDSYIDTKVSHDYEGAYYICNMCLAEMAKMQAFMSFDEYKDLRASKEDLERINFELIKRVGQLEEIHDALARAGYKRTDDGDLVRVTGYVPPAIVQREERTSGTEDLLGIGEGEITEQSHDQGVGELYSDEPSSDSEFTLDF